VQWEMVDEGWGRRASTFATLSEPSACREYVSIHHRLGIGPGDRVLDMACGSGLALELAAARGAVCAGIDASPRLIAVAKHRSPEADLRVGDMGALPWDDGSFDVVTSFRGIWGTTPGAVAEAHRVLAPGGRLSITCWGNVRKSPGAWMMIPFLWATEDKIEHQGAMVSLGRPGVGEAFLAEHGFEVEERFGVPFCFEYPDPETYARGLAATGPAYEAIQSIGEDEFLARATELAREHVQDGLPLRGEIELFGYIGTKS
jgi:SAM-dependent methyltransferase